MPIATLTSKGQITLPAELRAQMGLRPGDKIDFRVGLDGTIEMHPLRIDFRSLRGILRSSRKRPATVREMDAGIRRYIREDWSRQNKGKR
jgi:AbrB family looped-hinge helix DNA binding protein